MNLKRKIIQIALVTIIVLLNIQFEYVSAEQEISDSYLKYVHILNNFDVLHDSDSYLSSSEEIVTRAEVAYAAAKLLNLNADNSVDFVDLSKSHWAYSQIGQIVPLKVMQGTLRGGFLPDEAINLADASQTLAKILCMELLLTTDKDGFVTKAINSTLSKVTSGIGSTDKQGVTRNQFVKMLINTLDLDVIELTSIGTGANYYFEAQQVSGVTVLSKYHDIYKINAIIDANERTSLLSPIGVSENKVKIADSIYNVGTTNIDEYLGYNVVAYVKKDESKNEDTVFTFYETKNNIITILDEDISSAQRYKINYEANEKTRNVRLSKFSDVIYNGVMADNITGDDFCVQDGFLTLIDNSGDGDYDVVLVNSFDDYLIKSINWEEDKIFEMPYGINPSRILDIDEYNSNLIYKLGGKEITREEFEKYVEAEDVLTVLQSKNSQYKKTVQIYIGFDKVSGIIKEKSEDEFIKIGNREYRLTNTAIKEQRANNFDVGDNVQLYFNGFGKIVYIKTSTEQYENPEAYGYLLNVKSKNGLGNSASFLLFTKAGETIMLDANDKIIFNKSRVYPKDVVTSLSIGGFKSQLVRYAEKEGSLTKLYTATIGKDKDKFSLDCILLTATFNNNIRSYIFDSKTIDPMFDSKTTNSMVSTRFDATYGVEFSTGIKPRALWVSQRDDNGIIGEDNIAWIDEAALGEGTKWDKVSAYDLDEAHVANVAVIENSKDNQTLDFRGGNFKWFVVSKVVESIDNNGEACVKVYGFHEGKEKSYSLDEIIVEETIVKKGDGTNPAPTPVTSVNEYDIKRYADFIAAGDVLQAKVTLKGEIQNFRRVFTYTAKNPDEYDKNIIYASEGYRMVDRQSASFGTNSGSLYIYGKVIGKTHDNKVLIKTDVGGIEVLKSRTLLERTDVNFYSMKREGKTILTLAKPADVIGDEMSGSDVLVQSRVTGLIDIVILK